MRKSFPFYKQMDEADCGPTCLRMIAKHYGKNYSQSYLRDKSYISRAGVSLLGLSDAAQAIGLRPLAVSIPYTVLINEAPLPCIVHWKQEHFIVLYKVKKGKLFVADPAHGLLKYSINEFLDGWLGSQRDDATTGPILLLEATPEFYNQDTVNSKDGLSFSYLFDYLRPYKKFIIQLGLGMLIGSLLALIFPFLTQALVDRGIEYRDINFVYLILLAHILLVTSQTVVRFIQSWIALHVSARVNISLISDFLAKLMRLPVSYFETRVVGDIMQRIDDHARIEQFMTGSSISILFSFFNFIVFGSLLAYFHLTIFTVFVVFGLLYFGWILLFLKKREELDYRNFDQMSKENNSIVEIVNAMQDIKLNNAEMEKRWQWERIQAKLFNIEVESLKLQQMQEVGAFFLTNISSILISFLSAKAVIDGEMTLGTMMAVQSIVGQASAPLGALIGFVGTLQNAKISLDRLNDVRKVEDEEPNNVQRLHKMPENRDLVIKDLSFTYGGPSSPKVLKNVNLTIPSGKVTAFVGASGSGKTTLLKLLLKFFPPTDGAIHLGPRQLSAYNSNWWRMQCGTVMQEGFIYSDSIIKNIAIGDDSVNYDKVLESVKVANIHEFIDLLPMGFQTVIGAEGAGVSQGQKQRLLIARAVYKNPRYLFFDEATSALDANNERVIMENLDRFFEGRTVVVVAHRLSTVKNADNIVVLHQGEVVEQGTHEELARSKGYYFNLVKNQLELGG